MSSIHYGTDSNSFKCIFLEKACCWGADNDFSAQNPYLSDVLPFLKRNIITVLQKCLRVNFPYKRPLFPFFEQIYVNPNSCHSNQTCTQ